MSTTLTATTFTTESFSRERYEARMEIRHEDYVGILYAIRTGRLQQACDLLDMALAADSLAPEQANELAELLYDRMTR